MNNRKIFFMNFIFPNFFRNISQKLQCFTSDNKPRRFKINSICKINILTFINFFKNFTESIFMPCSLMHRDFFCLIYNKKIFIFKNNHFFIFFKIILRNLQFFYFIFYFLIFFNISH